MKSSVLIPAVLLVMVIAGSQLHAADAAVCKSDIERNAVEKLGMSLPKRDAPATKTSGTVPHVQIDAKTDDAINDTLRGLAFALPGVSEKPTIVSLPGALGMWLEKGVSVAQPKTIISGREFSHIHVDGSLHTPLPPARAREVAELGWGERHPWAERFDGWDGLVMLFSPRTSEELSVVYQLIVESYNYVTGRSYGISGC